MIRPYNRPGLSLGGVSISALRELTFEAARFAGKVLPLTVLLVLLYPIALLRAAFDTIARRGKFLTPRALPPVGRSASFRVELRERTSAWLSTAALLWADRFARPPWSSRLDVGDLERVRSTASTRPVLIATLHFGGIFLMPTLLRAYGVPTAAVVGDKLWPVRWWRERRAQLTSIDGLPTHLRSGDARAMMRYLQPGRCLLVALDYPIGDQVATPYGGSAMRLSTASFRLARLTGAAIVPVLVRVEGPWRYSLHVGQPVPDELLAREDDAAVLAHIVNELMPVAEVKPEQALPLLVNAFERAVRA